MKKIFLVFALGMSLCANAQLTVFENGLVRLGNHITSDDSWGATDVRAVDSINVGSGLNILSKGKLSLRCDKDVSLDGAEVATGGRLTVKGEKVTLSNGFSVKVGAALSITTN